MMTFRLFMAKPEMIPTAASWYLADLGEARGKQELFTKQSPQKLKVLREHALIESAVSSNRIEGVEVEPARIKPILFGKGSLRSRDEEEVRGYRDALKLIHQQGRTLPISEGTIKRLHQSARGGIGDAGRYKSQDSDIIERLPDGRMRVRFKTIPASRTPEAMREFRGEERWNASGVAQEPNGEERVRSQRKGNKEGNSLSADETREVMNPQCRLRRWMREWG
ncbi:MAG TPA: hypothetical protein VFG71_01220, partial [Nitrospiraceae bacterium]|nr:hypothetical protein [Nitrospiraceae bacterium]